jgi:hypothetical protein
LHTPLSQVSDCVHALPSSHGPGIAVCWQPAVLLHESSVQAFASSQSGGAPPTHALPTQASAVVQASPSSQAPVRGEKTHPFAGLQLSSVQGLLSLHVSAGPPVQAPSAQASWVVQTSPSLHGSVFST